MDDGTNGWMEKASRPRRPLLYVMLQSMMKLGEDGITSSNKVIGKVTQFLSLSLTL
jgi:hypothetical protein